MTNINVKEVMQDLVDKVTDETLSARITDEKEKARRYAFKLILDSWIELQKDNDWSDCIAADLAKAALQVSHADGYAERGIDDSLGLNDSIEIAAED